MKTLATQFVIVSVLLVAACSGGDVRYRENTQWNIRFDRPASIWEETLPLGNGRLGMMPDGGVDRETIVLNDITLWSGGVEDANNPQAAQYLPEIRRLLLEGRNDEAQELVYRTFVCKGSGSGAGTRGSEVPFGSYELLGNLHIDYQYAAGGAATNYDRQLLLNDAVATTRFTADGTEYVREYFTDYVRDVMVIRLHASESGKLNFQLGMDRPRAFSTSLDGNQLVMKGQLNNGTDGKGMRYEARAAIRITGAGTVDGRDGKLCVAGAQEAEIIVSAMTDYADADYAATCVRLLENALKAGDYHTCRAQHSDAFRRFFDRASLHLKRDAGRDTMVIDRRLEAFAADHCDNGLVELYFQFGRYLLISSTREGLLPPNLQGLWANTVHTPWNGDYHLNINVQMNHWPAEVTNLSELHLPLVQLTENLVSPGKVTARIFYNAEGWVAHMMTNIWGFTAPGEHPSWGATNTGGAWLCAHLWEHYAFTGDSAYLQRIYPVLKGASEFFLNTLIEEPSHGWLVTAPTTSPENTYLMPGTNKAVNVCMGSTMDNQLVRELFRNTAAAAQILDVDADFSYRLHESIGKLPPNRIGADGRLMEWLEEYVEREPQHRHISHLYGLHPGSEITPAQTPDLAAAARKTLEVRGDGSTGWSRAWKINFWARLGDGNHAYKLFCNLLVPTRSTHTEYRNDGGTFPNLFCAHPPFQIDGNFGGCAGIAEMLVQSHTGVVELLPALPDAMSDGTFDGLCVRGGAEISAAWQNRLLTSALLKATANNTFHLKIPDGAQARFKKNKKQLDVAVINGVVALPMKKGDAVQALFTHPQ